MSRGGGLVFGYDAVVDLLQVLLHLVWPRELLLTDGTGKHLPVGPLVVEKCVSLEAVLVLEALHNLDLFTLYASVRPVACNVSIFEQIQSSDTHVLQGLGVRPRLAGQVAPGPRVWVRGVNRAGALPLLAEVARRVDLSNRLSNRLFTGLLSRSHQQT